MLNTKNKNKGQVLVLVALSLVVFIGFAALAIDIAYFYHTKHQLQGAADAAALAGASQLRGATDVAAFGNHSSARREAWKFACKNKAAGQDTYVVVAEADRAGCDNVPSGVYVGNTGDIVVGNWSGSFTPGGTPVNAVQVTARRTDAPTEGTGMSKVKTFFGGIFGLIPGGSAVKYVSISAKAIAAITQAKVLPIAVNEYWLEGDASRQPYAPCAHAYPRSFVRKTTVGNQDNVPPSPTDPADCRSWGRTFAILGVNAESNVNPQNINSYVYLDTRSRNHDGSGVSWFDVDPDADVSCDNCSDGFKKVYGIYTAGTKTTGDISPQKFREHLTYLHKGFPDNYLLPTAVEEQYRVGYTASNYPIPTSECPYATVPYFPSGGGQPINKDKALEDEVDGMKFYDRFPKGQKVVALVYDGTYVPTPGKPYAVTIVGYVLLEIDGYSPANPRNLLNPNFLRDRGSTAYAHAISDIEEPSSSFGTCDTAFFDAVRTLKMQGGNIRLVQ